MQNVSDVCKDSQWFLYYHYSIRYVQYFSNKIWNINGQSIIPGCEIKCS